MIECKQRPKALEVLCISTQYLMHEIWIQE
jgi:hypothetical protein